MTNRYAHLAPEHLRSAAASLDGMLNGARTAHEPVAVIASKESCAATS
jgi:hypothetical protein